MGKIKITIIGATGRMGRELIRAISDDENTTLVAAIEKNDSENIGKYALEFVTGEKSGCKITSDITKALQDSDVAIDFSGAKATMGYFEEYKNTSKPIVIGSTGFADEEREKLLTLSNTTAFFIAANMSVGVNMMIELARKTSKALGEDFDIEIFEAHHKHKIDAPSGTALALGDACAEGLGEKLSDIAVYTRHGITGARKKGTIGFQVLRGADIVGEHTVFYCGEGERLEITHRATSRSIFAKGALRAAKWLYDKPSGLYGMKELLGL